MNFKKEIKYRFFDAQDLVKILKSLKNKINF